MRQTLRVWHLEKLVLVLVLQTVTGSVALAWLSRAAAEPGLSCMAAFSGCAVRPAFASSLVWWPHMLKILGLFVRNVSHFSACSGGLEGGDGHRLI